MSAVLSEKEFPAASMTQEPPIVDMASMSAAERLALSRARLRTALMDIANPPPRTSAFDGFDGLKGQLLGFAKSIPGASLILETLHTWWQQHPLHAAGVMAEEASRSFIVPLARRNPLGLIVGALVVGGLLTVSRPWKWLLRPALFIGIVPQLVAQGLKRVPIESLMQMLDSFLPATDKPAARNERASDLPGAP